MLREVFGEEIEESRCLQLPQGAQRLLQLFLIGWRHRAQIDEDTIMGNSGDNRRIPLT